MYEKEQQILVSAVTNVVGLILLREPHPPHAGALAKKRDRCYFLVLDIARTRRLQPRKSSQAAELATTRQQLLSTLRLVSCYY